MSHTSTELYGVQKGGRTGSIKRIPPPPKGSATRTNQRPDPSRATPRSSQLSSRTSSQSALAIPLRKVITPPRGKLPMTRKKGPPTLPKARSQASKADIAAAVENYEPEYEEYEQYEQQEQIEEQPHHGGSTREPQEYQEEPEPEQQPERAVATQEQHGITSSGAGPRLMRNNERVEILAGLTVHWERFGVEALAMSSLFGLLDPISAAAASSWKTLSDAAADAADKLTGPAQPAKPIRRSPSSGGRTGRAQARVASDGEPPFQPAPRSSSLPSLPTAEDVQDLQDSMQVSQSADSVEGTFEFMAKVPSLASFGFGGFFDYSKDGSLGDSSDDEAEAVRMRVLNGESSDGNDSDPGLPPSGGHRTPKKSATVSGGSGWGGLGMNLTMPNMAFLTPSSSPTPPPDPRSASPDASAATTAAAALSKVWSSITGSNTRHLRPCGHRHIFDFLDGDVVVLGGMYGSFLSEKGTGKKVWLTMDSLLGFASVDVGLRLDGVDDRLEPSGIFERLGPINVCADLCSEFRSQEGCSNGTFRFHPFAYDWRREPDVSSVALEKHLEGIYAQNGSRPITVLAHSMGGLLTLAVVNRRPELFRGVVFIGSPFGGVPLILWQLRRGIPFMLNKHLMSPDLHFGARSSFVFLPMDGRALVVDAKDGSGEEDYLVDFYSAEEWINHTLSKTLHRAARANTLDAHKEYLQKTLHSAKAFRQSLAFNPDTSVAYPPLTHLVSSNWPTATRIKCSASPAPSASPSPNSVAPSPTSSSSSIATAPTAQPPPTVKSPHSPTRTETHFVRPARFEDGDGIVSRDAMTLPPGFPVEYVDTTVGHWGLMNDLRGIRKCLKKIVEAEKARAKDRVSADSQPEPPRESAAGDDGDGMPMADPAHLDEAGDDRVAREPSGTHLLHPLEDVTR
ncbi:hypothetical protein HKX48_003739 [Thoreauomyces humboldtii]|nr:hypothetical protein HKX48_003739 [Thoreauomyces humboldtii]